MLLELNRKLSIPEMRIVDPCLKQFPWICNLIACSIIILVVYVAVGSLSSAMKCTVLENLPIIVNITVFPEDIEKPGTKSGGMCDHG